MAVKTITIDLMAYGLLARCKREGQSFSDVIKDHFRRPLTAGELKARLRTKRPLSEDLLDAVDEVIRDRANSPVRYPEL